MMLLSGDGVPGRYYGEAGHRRFYGLVILIMYYERKLNESWIRRKFRQNFTFCGTLKLNLRCLYDIFIAVKEMKNAKHSG